MGFRLTPQALEELDEHRVVLSIPLERVKSAQLKHGFVAERLVPSLVLAVLVCLGGVVCAVSLLRWFAGIGRLSRYVGAGVALIPFGAWLVRSTLKRGWYLDVDMGSERRKLDVMPCGMSLENLRAALQSALGATFSG
jgi:hypothetical protein